MPDHILLEVDNLDALLSRFIAECENWTAEALPTSAEQRRSLCEAIDADIKNWEEVLFETIMGISHEQLAIETGPIASLRTPSEPVDYSGLERIRNAPYCRYFERKEMVQIGSAIKQLWELYKKSKKLLPKYQNFWTQADSLFREAKGQLEQAETEIQKLDKEGQREVRRFLALTDERRGVVFTVIKHFIWRAIGLEDMRAVLKILRDLFSATLALRKRLGGETTQTTNDDTGEMDIAAATTNAKLESEARTALAEMGLISVVTTASLSDTNLKYIVWFRWRLRMPVKDICKKWNREYPHLSLNGDSAIQGAHVRTGLGRAKLIVEAAKTKIS